MISTARGRPRSALGAVTLTAAAWPDPVAGGSMANWRRSTRCADLGQVAGSVAALGLALRWPHPHGEPGSRRHEAREVGCLRLRDGGPAHAISSMIRNRRGMAATERPSSQGQCAGQPSIARSNTGGLRSRVRTFESCRGHPSWSCTNPADLVQMEVSMVDDRGHMRLASCGRRSYLLAYLLPASRSAIRSSTASSLAIQIWVIWRG